MDAKSLVVANVDLNELNECLYAWCYFLNISADAQGALRALKALLERRADPNAPLGGNGVTPMHQAAANGYGPEVIQMLSDYGDVNGRDNAGRTPLYFASGPGHARTVKALLDAKASPDGAAPYSAGNTSPVLAAARYASPVLAAAKHEVVRLLVAAGVNTCCLHLAIEYAAENEMHRNTWEMLVQYKWLMDRDLALFIAVMNKNPTEVEKCLRVLGHDPQCGVNMPLDEPGMTVHALASKPTWGNAVCEACLRTVRLSLHWKPHHEVHRLFPQPLRHGVWHVLLLATRRGLWLPFNIWAMIISCLPRDWAFECQ